MAILLENKVTNSDRSITALAYIRFNGETPAFLYGHHISSFSRTTTGAYTIGFSQALPTVDYTVTQWARHPGNTTGNATGLSAASNSTKTTFDLAVNAHRWDSGGRANCNEGHIAVFC